MSRLHLITPPDILHNANVSVLLINPSDAVKTDFNQAVLHVQREINLYLYEKTFEQQDWLISVINSVDYIVLDINPTIKDFWLLGYILSMPHTFYISMQDPHPSLFHLLNANRIYDFKKLVEKINEE